MKKILFVNLFLLVFTTLSFAQGSLQFNAAKIVTASDGIQTVPANQVWKVMSVFGGNTLIFPCLAVRPYCVSTSWPTPSISNVKGKGYKVNGIVVWSAHDLTDPNTRLYYQNNDCTGSFTTLTSYPDCEESGKGQSFEELAATLPFWIPAGATLEALGSETYISVLEFNIIP